jgi:hypothetical protein
MPPSGLGVEVAEQLPETWAADAAWAARAAE